MTSTACPVCASPLWKVVFADTLGMDAPRFNYAFGPEHSRIYRTLRCLGCSHLYASPIPAELASHYEDVVDEVYLSHEASHRATARRVLKTLQKYRSSGRLLDVGCATGSFIEESKAYYDSEGVELSGWAADIARTRGVTVHRMRLSKLAPSRPYDLVTLWGVIEHFSAPAEEVGHVARLLSPGGYAAVWTGDGDSVLARVLGKKWWWVQGQHIQIFTRRSLQRLFAAHGFEEVACGTYPLVATLAQLCNSLSRYPLLTAALAPVLTHAAIAPLSLTVRLPGEMFAVYRKRP